MFLSGLVCALKDLTAPPLLHGQQHTEPPTQPSLMRKSALGSGSVYFGFPVPEACFEPTRIPKHSVNNQLASHFRALLSAHPGGISSPTTKPQSISASPSCPNPGCGRELDTKSTGEAQAVHTDLIYSVS